MCFAPEADLVGGAIAAAIGVDCVAHVRNRREIPLASLPLLLGTHELVEAVLWWGTRGRFSPSLTQAAVWIYLVFAFCVLPILIPAGVMGIEPTRRKRIRMAPFLALGGFISAVLAFNLITRPFKVVTYSHHLDYKGNIAAGGIIVALYVVVTCVPLLLSGYKHVVVFGAVNVTAAAAIAAMLASGFTSLWCAWAAVASAAIALHLRFTKLHRGPERTGNKQNLVTITPVVGAEHS